MTETRKIYCCQCNSDVDARLTSGSEIYPHRKDLYHIPFWKCDACKNYVGCHHKTSNKTNPLGVIPNGELRAKRLEIHRLLDPLWMSHRFTRGYVYKQISKRIGHVYHTGGVATVKEADEVIAIVKDLLKLESKMNDNLYTVLAAKVNWCDRFQNPPQLELLLGGEDPDFRYEKRKTAYFANYRGLCSFFAYAGPGEGFGGRTFILQMKDGSTEKLIGPWSGNSRFTREAGFEECMEVSYTFSEERFNKGYTFYAGAVTLELAKKAISKISLNEGKIIIKRDICGFDNIIRVDDDGNEIGKPTNPEWRLDQ